MKGSLRMQGGRAAPKRRQGRIPREAAHGLSVVSRNGVCPLEVSPVGIDIVSMTRGRMVSNDRLSRPERSCSYVCFFRAGLSAGRLAVLKIDALSARPIFDNVGTGQQSRLAILLLVPAGRINVSLLKFVPAPSRRQA